MSCLTLNLFRQPLHRREEAFERLVDVFREGLAGGVPALPPGCKRVSGGECRLRGFSADRRRRNGGPVVSVQQFFKPAAYIVEVIL